MGVGQMSDVECPMGANSAGCKRGRGYGWVGWVAMVVLCAGLLSGSPALFGADGGRDSLVQRKAAARTAGAGEFGALQNNLHGQKALAQALRDGSETSMIGSLLDVVNRDISSRMTGPTDGQSLQSKHLSLYFYCHKYMEAKAEMLAKGKGHYTTERYLNLCHTQDCDMSSRRGTDGTTEFKYMNSDGMFYSEPDQKWCADNADDARCKTCDEVTEPVHPMCSACPALVSNTTVQVLQEKELSLYFYCQKYVEAKAELLAKGTRKGHHTTGRYLNLCQTQDCDMSSRRGTDGATEFKYMNIDGMFYSEPDQKWCADNADDARCKTCDEVTEPVHPMCSACPVVHISNTSITGQRLLSKVGGGKMPATPQAFNTAQVNSKYRMQALAEITSGLSKGLQALGQEPLQVYEYCATFMDMRAEMYRKGRNKRSGRWRGERRTGQELAKCAAQDCSIYTRHHPTFMNEEGMFYHPEGQQSCEVNPSDPRYMSASACTQARAHRACLHVCTRAHTHTHKSHAQAHTSHGVQFHILI